MGKALSGELSSTRTGFFLTDSVTKLPLACKKNLGHPLTRKIRAVIRQECKKNPYNICYSVSNLTDAPDKRGY